MAEPITLKELQTDLSSVAANWDSLAVHLQFGLDETNVMKANVTGTSGRVEFCFNRVIATWLSGPRENITREVLASAVKSSGFGNLAREILNDDHLKLDLRSVLQKLQTCKAKYHSLGVFLNISMATISEFETFSGDCSRCLLIMLDSYLRDKRPSVQELCAALVVISRRNLATTLEKKYEGRTFEVLS